MGLVRMECPNDESNIGKGSCNKCSFVLICRTAMSPNADEIITKARREMGIV